jgi:hypothetical protein
MKLEVVTPVAIAVLSLAFCSQQPARAQSAADSGDQAGAQQEASQMVSARAELVKSLDGRKAQDGQQFEAKLNGTVHLKNGTELPHGTVLVGVVSNDKMQQNGSSTLALRFTQAKLKDGQALPIKAMIVGISRPQSDVAPAVADELPAPWNGKTVAVDEVGAVSGADLHSRVTSDNSGVFISAKKDDVKLSGGSELTLAIAAGPGASASGGQ